MTPKYLSFDSFLRFAGLQYLIVVFHLGRDRRDKLASILFVGEIKVEEEEWLSTYTWRYKNHSLFSIRKVSTWSDVFLIDLAPAPTLYCSA